MGLRLLWHSNSPWSPSGYGQQTLENCKRIQKMPEVEQIIISCFYGLHGGVVEYEGLVCIPPRMGDWGNQCLQLHSYHTNSDVVIGLQDTWVLRQDMAQQGFLWIPWTPIDHEPLPQMIAERVATSYMPLAMSKWGRDMMIAANMKNVNYVPHCVDTRVYKQHSKDVKNEMRDKLGIPRDVFLVGTVAANKGFPARKGWPQLIEALSHFMNRHDDVYAYFHTLATAEDQGVDMPGIIRSFNCGDKVLMPNPYLYLQGFPQEEMSKIYSTFDVFLLPSFGEGFGIPIIEAQACGVPVIVTDFSAMPELVGAGDLIDVAYKWYTPLYSYQALPSIEHIVELLEKHYGYSEIERRRLGREARRHTVENYDANMVAEKYWTPIIRELADVTNKRTFSLN